MSELRNYGLTPLGAGIGLRRQHFPDIINQQPQVNWFEVIPENYLGRGGFVTDALRRIAERYTLVGHGVSLSIGSTDPLNMTLLKEVKEFCDTCRCSWYSDHLCFTMVDHVNLNDLIPLPFTQEAVKHVAQRVKIVQEVLERPFLLENVTYYMQIAKSQMTEPEFISAVLEEADCGLMLDVSNVILNASNHDFDPIGFLDSIPLHRVGQLHLGGFEKHGGILLDTHAKPVAEETWALYQEVLERIGPTSALIEWDFEIPSLARLLQEAGMAQKLMDDITQSHHPATSP